MAARHGIVHGSPSRAPHPTGEAGRAANADQTGDVRDPSTFDPVRRQPVSFYADRADEAKPKSPTRCCDLPRCVRRRSSCAAVVQGAMRRLRLRSPRRIGAARSDRCSPARSR